MKSDNTFSELKKELKAMQDGIDNCLKSRGKQPCAICEAAGPLIGKVHHAVDIANSLLSNDKTYA